MQITAKIKEKGYKLICYIKLSIMFAEKNEFSRIHPELVPLWKRKFYQMIRYSSNRIFPILEEFLTVKIDKVSDRELVQSDSHKPILICVLKNEVIKIQYFMEHYRKLGIENFVFLDNMSTDGTFEFLLEQEDAIVYRCEHPFVSNRKIAWINRLIAEIGLNRWYLMVDSDEFITYLGCSEHNIEDVVMQNESRGFKRVASFMIDMYPKENLFTENEGSDFYRKCCCMDKDTYSFSKAANGIRIMGGPRKRVFGTNMKLSKYCLFYFEEDDIVPSSHFLIPFEKSFDVPVSIGILHYKFVNESDYQKMIESVRTECYSNNSAEYKTYYNVLKDRNPVSLYDEKHSILFSEENLRKIGLIEDMFSM